MKAIIRDKGALFAVSPASLSAYASAAGWARIEAYGDYSDIYFADGLPEIVLPRTHDIGDYAEVVSQLIKIFAHVANMDELSIYRDLVVSDRDMIRVRASEDGIDGSVEAEAGATLIRGACDMVFAAACSLREPRPFYRTSKEAKNYLRQMRLGQTEQGSFVITLLSPYIALPQQALSEELESINDDPIGRRVTKRLSNALEATRKATSKAITGDNSLFPEVVRHGASANLCEALAMLTEPFQKLDVNFVWARTLPMDTIRDDVHFVRNDAPVLLEAARLFRALEPRPEAKLIGYVKKLKREEKEIAGTISLQALYGERALSVTMVLDQSDYSKAIKAHETKARIVVKGNLERIGQRWHLGDPHIIDVTEGGNTMFDEKNK